MSRPMCIIQSPISSRSGYGDMARDIARHVIDLDRYEVKLVSLPWGNTPMNALSEDNPKDMPLIERLVIPPVQLPRQPELFIQISVPNEFNPIGKYNIGITAGIETTICSGEFIQGCNRMDVVFASSEHSANVFKGTVMTQHDQQGNPVGQVKLEKPMEVLHNCVDTNIFRKTDDISYNIKEALREIPEKFCFLFVGHWLKGGLGEDRKNVGLLIKTFCETFKNTTTANRPALIVKTSGATFSIMDQDEILHKIRLIRESVGQYAPNVYLIHGELSEKEMNSLYNHPKVKAHVSFTKGEGFGRPLLEATMSEKPVIVSGWSGHIDFLNAEDALLLNGKMMQVEPGAVVPGLILAEAQWFNVDTQMGSAAMRHAVKNYDKLLVGAKRLTKKNREQFNYDKIKSNTAALLDKYVPQFAMPVEMKLPTLKKIK